MSKVTFVVVTRAEMADFLLDVTDGQPICGEDTATRHRCPHCDYPYSAVHAEHVDYRADGTNAWCVYECIRCGAAVTLHDWVNGDPLP